ncbi:MAG: tetratricopeptide repeat protein [Planctomycetota bacterium]|nr:tetratricopeptide repeat protein [Planctomycetota bacterium]
MTEKSIGNRPLAVAALVLAILVAWTYWGVLAHEFVAIDTAVYLADNEHVNTGWSLANVRWAFTTFHAANWHPLTWISHMIDVELFGSKPAGHHALNVLLHATNSVLLVWILARATGRSGASCVVAAVFAVHPLHVESVAWIVERKDLLATLFGFLSIAAWMRHACCGSKFAYVAASVLFACSLMSKPMLVTLPFVLLLMDAWPLARTKRGWGSLVLEKTPLFALAALSCWITLKAQSAGGAVQGLADMTLAARVENAVAGIGWYATKIVWPSDLSFFYPLASTRSIDVVFGAALVLIASLVAFATRAQRPQIAFGWCSFAGTLVPVLGLVQVGGQAHADRYAYFPLIGLSLAIVFVLDEIVRERRVKQLAAVITVLALAAMARERVEAWKDSETLARRALAVDSENYVARNLLGWSLFEKGRTEEGLVELERAVAIEPHDPDARRNYGRALMRIGRSADAERELKRAAQLRPNDAGVLADLGTLMSKRGAFDAAGTVLARAVELAPDDARTRLALGEHLDRHGDIVGSEAEFRRAVDLAPDDPRARVDLAAACMAQGRRDEARAHLDHALKFDAASAQASQLRAKLRAGDGDSSGAIADLRVALAARPNWPLAGADLAWLLATARDPALRRPAEALTLAHSAVNAGNNERALYLDVLAAAFAANGSFESAVTTAEFAEQRARDANETALALRIAKRLASYREAQLDSETPR